jgi:hypothetical protein
MNQLVESEKGLLSIPSRHCNNIPENNGLLKLFTGDSTSSVFRDYKNWWSPKSYQQYPQNFLEISILGMTI